MEINWQEVKDGIVAALSTGLEEAKGNLRDGWEKYGAQIADDTILVAASAARGDEVARKNLEHLMAQTKTLGAIIAMREEKAVVSTIQTILKVVIAVLSPALKAALA